MTHFEDALGHRVVECTMGFNGKDFSQWRICRDIGIALSYDYSDALAPKGHYDDGLPFEVE